MAKREQAAREPDLVKRSTVVELVRIYDQAQADIERGCALIAGAGTALDRAFKL